MISLLSLNHWVFWNFCRKGGGAGTTNSNRQWGACPKIFQLIGVCPREKLMEGQNYRNFLWKISLYQVLKRGIFLVAPAAPQSQPNWSIFYPFKTFSNDIICIKMVIWPNYRIQSNCCRKFTLVKMIYGYYISPKENWYWNKAVPIFIQ